MRTNDQAARDAALTDAEWELIRNSHDNWYQDEADAVRIAVQTILTGRLRAPRSEVAELKRELQQQRQSKARADELLERCRGGFSAYIMGRRLARRDRDQLLLAIDRYFSGHRQ